MFINGKVYAATYTPTTNLFEGTQTNNLIDMANSQVDNFSNKKYVAFQIDNDYYLAISDDFSINGNTIILNNSTLIRAIRNTGTSYNSYYDYSTITESTTSVNLNYIVISNIDTDKSVSSKRFDDYKFNIDLKNIGIFILGLCFAIFITKERKF